MSTKLKLALLTLAVSQLLLASPQSYASLGSSPVNTATAPVSVAFSTSPGSPSTFSLQYGSEFTVDSSSCNTDGDINVTSCNVTFTPHHPGLRVDALKVYDGEGTLLGTEYVYGIGLGPLPVSSPGTISTLYSQEGTITGIAKDSFGNIYFSNSAGAGTVTRNRFVRYVYHRSRNVKFFWV